MRFCQNFGLLNFKPFEREQTCSFLEVKENLKSNMPSNLTPKALPKIELLIWANLFNLGEKNSRENELKKR